jgi:hypothetical protein
MEGSGSGSGSVQINYESGSRPRRPKNLFQILNTVPEESSWKISYADGSHDDDTEFDTMETESSRR